MTKLKETHVLPKSAAIQRRPYTSPQLIVYGDLRALTAGGSGLVMEGSAMTSLMKFP